MAKRIYVLEIRVEAPTKTGESEIEAAINIALDEPPCDWRDWTVGSAVITNVYLVNED